MNAFVFVVSFAAGDELWNWLCVDRAGPASKTPEPPVADDEPDEPKRKYPFWTYFAENPRPIS